jgi:hypothetical protein
MNECEEAFLKMDTPSVSSRTAETMSRPSRQRRIISGMSDGGCCRSLSIMMTASPVAKSRPAVSAI